MCVVALLGTMNPFYIPMLVRITIFAALGGFVFG